MGVAGVVEDSGDVDVHAQRRGSRVVLGEAGVAADRQAQPPAVHFEHRGPVAGAEPLLGLVHVHLPVGHARAGPVNGQYRDVLAPRLALDRAPTSAVAPVSAHASTIGASLESSAVIAGASNSYPVNESSGKTTTRACAARIASACSAAFATTSYPVIRGWATAMTSD